MVYLTAKRTQREWERGRSERYTFDRGWVNQYSNKYYKGWCLATCSLELYISCKVVDLKSMKERSNYTLSSLDVISSATRTGNPVQSVAWSGCRDWACKFPRSADFFYAGNAVGRKPEPVKGGWTLLSQQPSNIWEREAPSLCSDISLMEYLQHRFQSMM